MRRNQYKRAPFFLSRAKVFPTFVGTVAETAASLSSPFDLNMPSGIVAGELLFALISRRSSGTGAYTLPAGWVELDDFQVDSVTRVCVAYKFADGTEGSTISVSVSAGTGSAVTRALITRIQNAHASSAPEMASVANGSGTTPNPPSLSPSWGSDKTLWIALFGCQNDTTANVTAYPTNYDDNQKFIPNSATTTIAWATRELEASSDDPGTFTISTSRTWGARTVGVRPI